MAHPMKGMARNNDPKWLSGIHKFGGGGLSPGGPGMGGPAGPHNDPRDERRIDGPHGQGMDDRPRMGMASPPMGAPPTPTPMMMPTAPMPTMPTPTAPMPTQQPMPGRIMGAHDQGMKRGGKVKRGKTR